MLNRFRFALMAAVAPLALTIPAAQAATPTQTLVMAMDFADLITFDPGESYEISGQEFGANIYDRLVRYEAEDLDKLVGGVAESWSIASDNKTYTFKLRPNLKFANGDPVTADDLAWSMQRVVLLDKTPAFLFTQLGWNKENVKSLITAPDPHTLTFKIVEDTAPSLVLNLMSTYAASAVDKKVAMSHEKDGDLGNAWLKTNSAASGAYNLISWKADEAVTLEANPGYRLASQHIKRVVIRHVPEPATQSLLLGKGDIDIARGLSPDQLASLGENKDIRIESFPGGDNYYLGLNTSEEHLKNPKVRQAMKMLVDYDGMVKTFLKDRFFVQQTFLPIGFLGAIPYNPWKFDVAKAKALLAEAGYANGFELELITPNASPWTDIAQSVQQTMGQGGIKLKLVQVEQKQMLQAMRARKFQMVQNSWAPDYKDPHSNADTFAHNDDDSDTPKIKPLAWRTHWLQPELTKETMAASREPDTAKRVKEYEDLQKKVTDDGPFILMFQDKYQVAMRSNVKGFKLGIFADFNYYRTVSK
ncbi:MAG TPA: ABC transporter substrate-binding protein [Stellaceae bacterium]|nr:ABC transporter substrate-binding protein [Stellaceae bacterium]